MLDWQVQQLERSQKQLDTVLTTQRASWEAAVRANLEMQRTWAPEPTPES